ncbi:hypothetical protein [Okeania sp. SIO3I5]|uniref:hypothetical protein n=1 Tax=Okeania sp. SIO3I5 TaxID=2607805 RepID=UPI0025D71016|nr:hypothetical protein [Okeania sp. SIO3I5]
MMLLDRYKGESAPIAPGHHTIEVNTSFRSLEPLSPADVVIRVDGSIVDSIEVERTVPGAFSASETFDVGTDLGSPVSLDYAENAPFPFTGKINTVKVELANPDARHFLPLPSPSFD